MSISHRVTTYTIDTRPHDSVSSQALQHSDNYSIPGGVRSTGLLLAAMPHGTQFNLYINYNSVVSVERHKTLDNTSTQNLQ